MTGSDWPTVLDELAAALAEQRSAVRSGTASAHEPFHPPSPRGPLPRELQPRAEALLVEARDLAAEISELLARTTRDLTVVRRFGQAAAPARPSIVDDAL